MNGFSNRALLVFTEASQLPADERATYLERACGSDAELRQHVEDLLRTHDHVGDFLEQSPQKLAMEAKVESSVGEKAGDRIGRYKLMQQIGEGGCGVVFMAQQEQPVRRQVALKIIKPGMDTKSIIARFEAERQALALMDHPNIAKILDAGATDSGRPYFVMELVRGLRITEYCNQHSLTIEERLKLFVQVCQAIQHAHQKGIIHRDIKPSNILVTPSVAGVAMPVIIDFGIAKATTDLRLTDKTVFTAFEMLIGTPAYMSPEQASASSVETDARTDIYSLGVLLYELLTGRTLFDVGELQKAGLDEIRRVIREQEPFSPSTRLIRLTEADLTTVAQHCKSDPHALVRAVRGDLDWIAMKALEKDRARRYETACGMAMDVQRYLANEPISARAPSKLYKLQKTVLRNKLLFGGLSVVIFLLGVSLIIVLVSFTRERYARREADAEAVKSHQITKFLEDMLQSAGPSIARGRDTTILRELLDRTAERIANEITNQPAVEADLCSLMGRVYQELGHYDQAEKMHRSALAIDRKLFGPESKETAMALNDLGLALFRANKLSQAESAHLEALRLRRALFGNENADVAASLNNLASVHRHQGRPKEAEIETREALGIRQKLFGENSLEVADTLHNLSIALGDEGRRTEAAETSRKMLAMKRKLLGPEDPSVASAMTDVAWAVNVAGNVDEAISLQREALAMQRKLLGDAAPDVGKSFSRLGELLTRQGKLEESRALLQFALSNQSKLLGDDNPISLETLRSLGLVLQAEGNWPESEKAHRNALASWRKRGEIETPQALSEVKSLTRVLMLQKKFGDAEQVLDDALTPALVRQPTSEELLALRAEIKARRSQWREAATDMSLAYALQPQQDERFATLAALLLKSQNRPAYEQFRKTLLTNFAKASNIFVADQVAKASLFLPPAAADMPVIAHLADIPVMLGAGDAGAMPFFEVCKALSEYRQGHFAEAIQWGERPLKIPRLYVHGHAYAVLAMAYWQLGKKDEAQAMLAKGNELAPNILPASVAEDPGNAWVAWLFARVQLDEASSLIRSTPATENQTRESSP